MGYITLLISLFAECLKSLSFLRKIQYSVQCKSILVQFTLFTAHEINVIVHLDVFYIIENVEGIDHILLSPCAFKQDNFMQIKL